jgi:predicted AlkP superfamily pyrophosphatase or phosphodiesterase
MKRLLLLWATGLTLFASAQTPARPKLVVGLVVDQMRWDFLYRYQDRYTANGFNRLLREGFSCENTFIPYTPTYTAAGHACVYTGSVPALNGIVGNNWYDPAKKRVVYCTEDNSVKTVGSTSDAGKMSPKNLWSTTITDELRLATNFRNKTIAIALKDRGAILPGGHTSNGSFWFDNATGAWVSSSFYTQQLPQWMQALNARRMPDAYLAGNWNTLFPVNTYKQSTADSNNYEGKLPGEDATFPHITSAITSNRYETFRYTPFANDYTIETAKAAIKGEGLGKSGFTDFLAVSFSTPDYIGHTFGPNSIEIEDTYLRLDRTLTGFLNYLDSAVGKGQYLVFLTADHGAAHNPRFLNDHGIPGNTYDNSAVMKGLNDSLERRFGVRGIVEHTINYQVYLNDSVLLSANLDRSVVKAYIIRHLQKQPGVSHVVDLEALGTEALPKELKEMLANGYNQKLCGDIQFIFQPQWFENWRLGTTHGLWNPYDAHIPLLFFGWKVKPGHLHREVYMTDIAPTLAAILKVQMPNACVGKVIEEVVK